MRILHATNAKIVQILRCPLHCGMGLPAMLIKNVKCFAARENPVKVCCGLGTNDKNEIIRLK